MTKHAYIPWWVTKTDTGHFADGMAGMKVYQYLPNLCVKLYSFLFYRGKEIKCGILMCWHHFWSGVRSSLKLWSTDREPDLRKNMNYDPKILSLFSYSVTLKHTLKRTHTNNPFLFVSSYCFFWSTVKTVNHEKKRKRQKKGVKRETRFRKGQAHSCGSVLQFLITVIGDWLSLLHPKELPRRQTSKLNTSSTLDTTLCSLQLTLPSQTSATLTSVSATLPWPSDIFWWWWWWWW